MDLNRPITVQITSGTIFSIVLIVGLSLLVYYMRSLVAIVLGSVVLATAIEPAVQWLMRRRLPRLIAVLSLYAGLVFLVFLAFYFLLPVFLTDVSAFLNMLPQYVDVDVVGQSNFLGFKNAFQDITYSQSFSEVVTNLSTAVSTADSETLLALLVSIFGGSLGLVLIGVMSFYLAAQPHGVDNFLKLITPREHEAYILDLWKRSQLKISYWLQGQVILGCVVGVLVYVGLTVLGIRHALLLALLVALFEIIPVFGSIISAIPAVIAGILDGGVTMGLLVAALYIVVQQLESNVFYPLVVKKLVGVPPLLVIISLVAGFEISGILGALLAVPIAATLVEYSDDIRRRRSDTQTL